MLSSKLSKQGKVVSMGYFYYSKSLNWAAQNPRLSRIRPVGRELDIAGVG